MQRENELGNECRAAAVMGTQFCALHGNPERAVELGRMGGLKNRHYIEIEPVNITLPSTAEDVKNVMGQAMIDVRAKKLDPRIAMALTSMSRVLLEAFQTADLQKRVERLEQARATAERSHEPLSPAADGGSD